MAKRKRLTPAPSAPPASDTAAPETKGLANGWAGLRTRPAPIADVAGASATQAALEEVAGEMADARREGRLVQRIGLDAIDETHLVRDRIDVDEAEMVPLMDSLRGRGQQTPIEVVDLGKGRYGLISGWRRLIALRRLRAETQSGDFAHALCLVRAPETSSDAYLAMVEENEIRAGLSFYERARIAARAAEQGAYPTPRHAVKGLFANASAPKRSKIVSFLGIYKALDSALRFPSALSERLGLALAKGLETDPELAPALRVKLKKVASAEAEQAIITELLKDKAPKRKAPAPPKPAAPPTEAAPMPSAPGIRIARSPRRMTLSGEGVTDALMDDLEAWLAGQK